MSIYVLRCTGCLEDSHILDVSKRITSEEELLMLGVKGLGLPNFKIQSALYDKKRILPAAYEVLSTWRKQQESGHDDYPNLISALEKVEMNQLAAELQEWVHRTAKQTKLTPERTKLPLLGCIWILLIPFFKNLLKYKIVGLSWQ